MNVKKYSLLIDKKRRRVFVVFNEPSRIDKEATAYLKYLLNIGKAFSTVINVGRSLVLYKNYLEDFDGRTMKEISRLKLNQQSVHFAKYLEYLKCGGHTLKSKEIRNETCNAYLSHIFRFYIYMARENESYELLSVLFTKRYSIVNGMGIVFYKTANSFDGYLRKSDERERDWADCNTTEKMLSEAANSRDKLILVLLISTGIRIGELLGIRFSDIDFEKKRLHIKARENSNNAHNKNEENRTLYIQEKVIRYMDQYISEYAEELEQSEYLFITLKGKNAGKPLTRDAVEKTFKRLSQKVDKNVTPHHCRHQFATTLYDDGMEPNKIRVLMGHRQLSTTLRYIEPDFKKLKEEMEFLQDSRNKNVADFEMIME